MKIPLTKLPPALRRRAAQHIESLRDSPMGAPNARLGDTAIPIFRPDLDEPAYYELTIELNRRRRRVATRDATALLTPSRERNTKQQHGFVILSAAAHDFPIPHWSLDRPPVAHQLAEAAKGEIARVYKLDALSYVAEDEREKLISQVGQIPLPLAGLPDDLRKASGQIASVHARTPKRTDDDSNAADLKHEIIRRGKGARQPEFLKVEDWRDYKQRYADSFAPLLRDLRRRARRSWQIDEMVEKFGEGLVAGEPHRIVLLESKAAAEIDGPAAEFVSIKMIERRDGTAAIELMAERAPKPEQADLRLHLSYGSGLSEQLTYFIVSPDATLGRDDVSGRAIFLEE